VAERERGGRRQHTHTGCRVCLYTASAARSAYSARDGAIGSCTLLRTLKRKPSVAVTEGLASHGLVPWHTQCRIGVTDEELQKNHSWVSPNCREFLHPDASWDVALFEATIVNLKLNLTVTYLGYGNMEKMLVKRTEQNIPTMFYWWMPEQLVVKVGGQKVRVPSALAGWRRGAASQGVTHASSPWQRQVGGEKGVTGAWVAGDPGGAC